MRNENKGRILTAVVKEPTRKRPKQLNYEQTIEALHISANKLAGDLPVVANVMYQAIAKMKAMHQQLSAIAQYNNAAGNFALNNGDGYTGFAEPISVETARNFLQGL